MTPPADATAPRVLGIADSDSYLKWAAGTLDRLPPAWQASIAVVRSPITPSRAQIAAAVAGTAARHSPPPVVRAASLRAHVERTSPDVLLAACTGPVVDVLLGELLGDLASRPAYVSGLPGIAIPANVRAWTYRSGVDLFIAHSAREARDYAALARELGLPAEVGLARLPFLDDVGHRPVPSGTPAARRTVVFAPQGKVPQEPADRCRILRALARLAARRPDLRPVVKLRGLRAEQQTHREPHPYDELWRALVRRGEVPAAAVEFAVGPMAAHLAGAAGFITVSSTAALEALALSVPVLVLSDFGVSDEMINGVFEGSGCLGTLADLEAGRFLAPEPTWLADNYFHPSAQCDWHQRLTALVDKRRQGALAAPRPPLDSPAAAAMRRKALRRLTVPPPLLAARNRAGRMLRSLRSLRSRRPARG